MLHPAVGAGIGRVFVCALLAAITLTACKEQTAEEKLWSATQKAADAWQQRRALNDYLKEYPNGRFRGPALAALKELRLKAMEAELISFGERSYYRDPVDELVKEHPDVSIAPALRDKQEQAYWRRAQALDGKEPADYPINHIIYLRRYPEGKWASAAIAHIGRPLYKIGESTKYRKTLREAVELLPEDNIWRKYSKALLADLEAWDEATTNDTYDAFLAYLKKWPNGTYKGEALAMMRHHSTWAPRGAADKVRDTIAFLASQADKIAVETDLSVKVDPARIDAFYAPGSPDAEALKRCMGNAAFVDLVDGFSLVARHYTRYRRFLYFGHEMVDGDKVKERTAGFISSLSGDHVQSLVSVAWKDVRLSDKQRRALKALAKLALQYHRDFEASFDKTASDAAKASYNWFQGGDLWMKLKFPQSADECLRLPFLLEQENMTDMQGNVRIYTVGISIETTLYDFWYLRTLDGTKANVAIALKSLAEAE